MSYKVEFAPEALAQLAAIEDYIANAGSPVTAMHYVDAILEYCEGLARILTVRPAPRGASAPARRPSPERMHG